MDFKKGIPLYLFFLYVPFIHGNNQLPALKGKNKSREIIFSPHMMTNKLSTMPNTTFSNIFGTNFSVSAWKLCPSSSPQDPIRSSFAIPKDFNSGGSLVVDIHLLINKLSGTGNKGKVRVNVCYQGSGSEIGINEPAEGFSQTVDSNNFTIVEPSQDSNLYHIKVCVRLDAELAKDCDFAYIAITRTTPSETEYDKDIYLTSVTFRYE